MSKNDENAEKVTKNAKNSEKVEKTAILGYNCEKMRKRRLIWKKYYALYVENTYLMK